MYKKLKEAGAFVPKDIAFKLEMDVKRGIISGSEAHARMQNADTMTYEKFLEKHLWRKDIEEGDIDGD
jgi:hypothetical protein